MRDVKTSFLFPPSSPSFTLSSQCIPPRLPYLWVWGSDSSNKHFLQPPHPHLDSPQIPSHTLNMASPIQPHPVLTRHVIGYNYWHTNLALHTALEDIERQLALPEFCSLGNTFPDNLERLSTAPTTTDGSESSLLFAYLTPDSMTVSLQIPCYVAGLVSYDSFWW
ncbi:hypothetical protein B0H14DRAFT_2606490 [Mycena olivaceomarginata]|nr:hypothetical protein B0H14DRAFT_2606490 [Mycena olivaceomarginata]